MEVVERLENPFASLKKYKLCYAAFFLRMSQLTPIFMLMIAGFPEVI